MPCVREAAAITDNRNAKSLRGAGAPHRGVFARVSVLRFYKRVSLKNARRGPTWIKHTGIYPLKWGIVSWFGQTIFQAVAITLAGG